VQEAEEGVLPADSAFKISSDPAASNGQYVYVPNGVGTRFDGPDENHKIIYTFNLLEEGTYRIKGTVYAANGSDDSFWVKVNDSPAGGYLWDVSQNTSYLQDYVNDRNGADPVEVWLPVGENTVTVYLREDGTRLDIIELEPLATAAPVSGEDGDGYTDPTDELVREAEDFDLPVDGDFEVGFDSAASGGAYVYFANGTGRRLSGPDESQKFNYTFYVPKAGTYQIKGAVYAANSDDDSFWIRVNDSPTGGYLWDVLQNSGYQQDYVNDRYGADPVEVSLEEGPNTITVYLREDGTRLDKIELEPVD
jgi:predicted secreted protein